MENKHIGKIFILFLLIFLSSLGSNAEALMQANVASDTAFAYTLLYTILGLCFSAFLSMTIPFACKVIRGEKLPHKKGKWICIFNSIFAFVVSIVLQGLYNILVVGGIGAIFYYFINKWMFVSDRDDVKAKEIPQMSLSFQEDSVKKHNHGDVPLNAMRLEKQESAPEVRVSKIQEEEMGTSPTEKFNKHTRYCSLCGKPINSKTKKCSGCGKQYFKGIPWKTIGIMMLVIIALCSLVLNFVLYTEMNKFSDSIASLEDKNMELQKKYDELRQQNTTLKSKKQELEQELSDCRWEIGIYDKYVVFVELDGTRLYHNFRCEKFIGDSCEVHHIDTAKNKGYKPCPLCCNS